MTCYARQYNDQMQCGICGLAWDVKDPEPPTCCPKKPVVRKFMTGDKHAVPAIDGRRFTAVTTAQIPVELPEQLAREMAMAFYAQDGVTQDYVQAMRAAYRVFMGSLP